MSICNHLHLAQRWNPECQFGGTVLKVDCDASKNTIYCLRCNFVPQRALESYLAFLSYKAKCLRTKVQVGNALPRFKTRTTTSKANKLDKYLLWISEASAEYDNRCSSHNKCFRRRGLYYIDLFRHRVSIIRWSGRLKCAWECRKSEERK